MYVESKVSRDKRLPLKFANTYIYICIEELITIRVQEIQEKRWDVVDNEAGNGPRVFRFPEASLISQEWKYSEVGIRGWARRGAERGGKEPGG